mgnify:CR=1 FL=1
MSEENLYIDFLCHFFSLFDCDVLDNWQKD